jgi:hypothetical protein
VANRTIYLNGAADQKARLNRLAQGSDHLRIGLSLGHSLLVHTSDDLMAPKTVVKTVVSSNAAQLAHPKMKARATTGMNHFQLRLNQFGWDEMYSITPP